MWYYYYDDVIPWYSYISLSSSLTILENDEGVGLEAAFSLTQTQGGVGQQVVPGSSGPDKQTHRRSVTPLQESLKVLDIECLFTSFFIRNIYLPEHTHWASINTTIYKITFHSIQANTYEGMGWHCRKVSGSKVSSRGHSFFPPDFPNEFRSFLASFFGVFAIVSSSSNTQLHSSTLSSNEGTASWLWVEITFKNKTQ